MTFRNRLQYLLVKRLKISNKAALELIIQKKILVNGEFVASNLDLQPDDEVIYEGQILKEGKRFEYIAYYKPRGIETTFNTEIADNLKQILPFADDIFPIGRLDKESEGLLLLTNDGRLYDKILRHENKTQKEYLVTVDKPIDDDFVERMSSGIKIMGQMTLPCKVVKKDDFTFKITLIQGLNRQIRRMCYKLNYEVTRLVRIRIGEIELGELQAGEWRKFDKSMV
ncbi:MAG: pseudouridine synthase [Spirosomataceae bacterium]